jgi:membrane-bound lytic murein transglycosylase A
LLQFPESQYEPLSFSDIPGWAEDDHVAAYNAFAVSCRSITAQRASAIETKPIGTSLRAPCFALRHEKAHDAAQARSFFERHFVPLRISRLGEPEGFVTGYYEPIVDGSRTPSDAFPVPVYRRPGNLFVRGFRQKDASLPNRGEVFRKVGRRKLVPFYDRGEIEEGALEKRGLEMAWLKSHTDLLFMQIQGSARIRFEDGATLRVNYDAHNGYPYTPVGRVLIERKIVPREEMSMQRIRQWMEDNPDGAKELRRQNRSYIFFRELKLGDDVGPVGAQGVHLTAGRSLAVDRALHVYGTPFFLEGQLPLESDNAKDSFRRLMVAQDTGSAIVGPARGDIYFGAGAEAGRLAGRLRHPIRFVMLLPKSLDPVEATRAMPLPDPRPSEEIAQALASRPDKAAKDAMPANEAATKETATRDAAKGTTTATEISADRKSARGAGKARVPQARPERRKSAPPHRVRHHPPT